MPPISGTPPLKLVPRWFPFVRKPPMLRWVAPWTPTITGNVSADGLVTLSKFGREEKLDIAVLVWFPEIGSKPRFRLETSTVVAVKFWLVSRLSRADAAAVSALMWLWSAKKFLAVS